MAVSYTHLTLPTIVFFRPVVLTKGIPTIFLTSSIP